MTSASKAAFDLGPAVDKALKELGMAAVEGMLVGVVEV